MNCRRIGEHGLSLIERISEKKNGKPVNILTHCNAGWLACIEYGTATAPVYTAFDKGIDLHVWVDETRPLNQGSRLTERGPDEIRYVTGANRDGRMETVLVPPETSPAANHAFDVTPEELVTGFITERGICTADESSILSLFPEKQ